MKIRALSGLTLFALLIGPQIVVAQTYATGKNGQGFTGTVNQTTTTNLSGIYPQATPSLSPGQQQQLTVDPQGNLNVHVQAGTLFASPIPIYAAPGSSPIPFSAATTLPIAGTVNVGNYPSVQPVSASGTFGVSGTVNVGNFPTSTTVTNIPSIYPISVASAIPVNCVSGCPTNSGSGSSGAVYPASGSSPFPIAASTTIPTHEQGTVPVTGSFYQPTQPVSLATTIPVSVSNTVPVSIATTIPVSIVGGGSGSSGAVYPAVGSSPFPISAATTIPVSGAFYQATQPVSIATTVPVSGTFYQSTQPVSIAAPVPVTGTFYPATQPVSVATTIPTHEQGTVPVTGSFYQATQPVSIATTVPVNVTFPTTQNVNIVASTPLPIQPVTLNVPSPLPIYAPSPIPIVPGTTNVTYYAGATSAGTVVKGSPGMLFGIINTSVTAQSPTMTCYNNATTASGNPLWSGTLQASQVVTFGSYGVTATNGIFCQPSAATNSGNGINFMWL